MSTDRMPPARSFTTNVVTTLGTKVLLVPIGIAASVLTARLLGPHDRGLLSILLTLAATATTFTRLGIYSANIYMIGRERQAPSVVMSNAVLLAGILGTSALVIIVLAREYLLQTILQGVPLLYLLLAMAVVPLELLTTYFRSALHAFHRFGLDNAIALALSIVSLTGTLVALVVFDAGLAGVLAVTLGVSVLTSVVLLAPIRASAGGFGRIDPALSLRMLRFGLKSYAQTLASYLHHRVDVYMLAIFLRPEQVAYYAIATRLVQLTLFAPEAAGTVLFPKLASLRTDAERSATTATMLRHVLLLTSVTAVGLWLVGRFVVAGLYGPAYAPVADPLIVMLPGAVMTSVFTIANRDLMARNQQHLTILCNATGLVLNVGLNLLLIPRWGIWGAAMASTTSYSVATLLVLWVFLKTSGYGWLEVFCFRDRDWQFYRTLWDKGWSRATGRQFPHGRVYEPASSRPEHSA